MEGYDLPPQGYHYRGQPANINGNTTVSKLAKFIQHENSVNQTDKYKDLYARIEDATVPVTNGNGNGKVVLVFAA